MNTSALIYDIEIKRCLPSGGTAEFNPKTGRPYEYCEGWHDYKGMGIAVLAVWDCERSVSLVFDEDSLDEFAALAQQRQYVSGFNIHSFDNRILAAFGVEIPRWKTFDVYREALIAAGLDPDERTPGGRKLNDFARVNFGLQKRENGADAPKMYQRGEMMRLINYCIDDTMLERRVFERARRGTLIDPLTRQILNLNVPQALRIEGAGA